MNRIGQAIRRHQELARREREFSRAYRTASGSDMRSELMNLQQFSGR